MKTMDKILVLMAVFLFMFTVTMIVIFCFMGDVPNTLIERVFIACLGEGGVMGAIQIAKVIKEKDNKEDLG